MQRSGGSVKIAVLLLHGCDLEDAMKLLERVDGRLRVAMDLLARQNEQSLDGGKQRS